MYALFSRPFYVAYIDPFCIVFYYEKAASRDPQSFELSSIDHYSSKLKPNKDDSNFYGVDIPMAGSDFEMKHTGEKGGRFWHGYQARLWRP